MMMSVVVLAGGEGRRIGGGKPLRQLGGATLIDRAVARARSWSKGPAVAVRDPEQVGGVDAAIIADDPAIEGPLGGLAAALRFARENEAETVVTIPADMPFLPAELPERLQASLGAFAVTIASSGGHLHPVCALWRTDTLGELEDYVATGRRSLRGFAETVGFAAADWPADPLDPFFNINSAADLEAAERLLRN